MRWCRERGAGEWNQALMELGATVCVPRVPRCEALPAAPLCRARRTNRVAAFPPAVARRAPVEVRRAVAWIARDGARADGAARGRVARRHVGAAGRRPPRRIAARPARSGLARSACRRELAPLRRSVRHVITHRAITVTVWRGAVRARRPRSPRLRWVDPARVTVPLTALARLCESAAGAQRARGPGR
jgi:A/G-specific adenine glycosylase